MMAATAKQYDWIDLDSGLFSIYVCTEFYLYRYSENISFNRKDICRKKKKFLRKLLQTKQPGFGL